MCDDRTKHRRGFLGAAGGLACWSAFRPLYELLAADGAAGNPLANYKLDWSGAIRWQNVVDVSRVRGDSIDEKLAAAQTMLAAGGGGVAYFPSGTYRFAESIKLLDGVVLRGATPKSVTAAHNDRYSLATKFEFPKYEPTFGGEGASIAAAFKGIVLAEPATASNCGVLHVDINRGHIHFEDDGSDEHRAGLNRFVVGCILRNSAVADPAVPNLKIGQHGWQRFTQRHHAAIDVKAAENILVANNRLPQSGDDNFSMSGFVLLDPKKKPTTFDGIVFDYDNRPGLYVNHYGIGGAGGGGPEGTPETHPFGFRRGIVIRDNFVFNTGRMGIGFCGDGVVCSSNVIRIPDDIFRPTATGQQLTTGASTNDNRAIEMRGWRWTVEENDYEVHRNWASDRKYKINDGEGLMHEDHVNSTVRDSILQNNRGNTYLSIYKTAGIDGLVIEGNDIRLGDGRQTIARGAAIFAVADRNSGRYPCRNVTITNNTVAGGGITIAGSPAEKNLIRNNKCLRDVAPIKNDAEAIVEGNLGFG
jgi:hypothetical protein